jgi:hypothetical protein
LLLVIGEQMPITATHLIGLVPHPGVDNPLI